MNDNRPTFGLTASVVLLVSLAAGSPALAATQSGPSRLTESLLRDSPGGIVTNTPPISNDTGTPPVVMYGSRGGDVGHSDVPDLPSMEPVKGGDDGWLRPSIGKYGTLGDDSTTLGTIGGEDFTSQNAPPPALTWDGPLPTGPTGANPGSFGGAQNFTNFGGQSTNDNIPAPGTLMLLGAAGALTSRRRRR